jgi:hypothetical protein
MGIFELKTIEAKIQKVEGGMRRHVRGEVGGQNQSVRFLIFVIV